MSIREIAAKSSGSSKNRDPCIGAVQHMKNHSARCDPCRAWHPKRVSGGFLRDRKTGWAALDQKRFFPAGLLLGGTIMIYLGLELAGRYTT